MTSNAVPAPHEEPIRIPTLPRSVERVRALMARPDVTVPDIVEAFLADPPLTAKVLRIANSAYYGRREKTISVQTALAFLGLRTLSMVVLRAGIMAAFDELDLKERATVEGIWRHSILTGHVCETLALRVRRRNSDWDANDYHTCGLLHDVGKIILYDNCGERYGEILRKNSARGEALELEEQRVLGMRHSEIGHMAVTFWGIPDPIPGMIRNLHRRAVPHDLADLTLAVRCADEIAAAVARHPAAETKFLRSEIETSLPGLSEGMLLEVVAAARETWSQLEL
ncbi:MAG: HDOD domain-containing protein [Planctomycetes bacterium]|nr:HDOD domain-containing protein [Planctomycetota bacterium]